MLMFVHQFFCFFAPAQLVCILAQQQCGPKYMLASTGRHSAGNPAAYADDGISKATDIKQLDFAASLMPSSLFVADLMLSCISSAASWPVTASWTQTQLDSYLGVEQFSFTLI